jgi:hypothetical protein
MTRHLPDVGEDGKAQPLGIRMAILRRQGHRLQHLEQVVGGHLQAQPGGIGPVLAVG